MHVDHALILAQPYAGLEAQARGLAERAGLGSSVHSLQPAAALELAAGRDLAHAAAGGGAARRAAGRAGARSGRGGGRGRGRRCARHGRTVVQIQNPRMRFERFDLVVANTHDEIAGPNVLLSRNALHRVGPALLADARATWAPRLAHLPRPLVAVLVGGSNGRFRLDAATGRALAAQLAGLIRRDRVGLALTPSRRTAPEVRAALAEALSPLGAWVWDMQGDNPYFGLLACADAIVVTADSVSMVSEAAATDVPVLVAELPGRSRRIGLFLRTLQQAGRIRMFDGRLQHWPTAALDDTPAVAHEMRRRLGIAGPVAPDQVSD